MVIYVCNGRTAIFLTGLLKYSTVLSSALLYSVLSYPIIIECHFAIVLYSIPFYIPLHSILFFFYSILLYSIPSLYALFHCPPFLVRIC